MSQSDSLQQLLRQGIDAAKRGENEAARRLLETVIARDENNELAWIWLASTVTTQRERRICLEKVLQINPGNSRAREALNALVGIGSRSGLSSADLEKGAARAATPYQGRLPFNPNSWTARIGVVVGVILLLFVLPSLLSPPPVQRTPSPLTRTPLPTAIPSPTIPPTFPGIRVTRDATALAALPPTFTPTFTPTATDTPTATATPFPLSEFILVVVARSQGQAQPGLYRYAGDGSGEPGLLENARDVAFDASGANIVFIRDVVYPADAAAGTAETIVGEVFIAPFSDVAAAQQVTELRTHSARHPIFNPHGREILFVSDYDGDDELWLVDPVTKITTPLTQNRLSDRDPSWSPDGRTIIFASDRESPGFSEIYALDFSATPGPFDASADHDSGYPVTRLTNENGICSSPVWSPDGTQIAFINDQDGDGDIYLMNATASRITLLAGDSGSESRSPAWTPDGRAVVFISNREEDRFQVYLVTLRGREVIRLIHDSRTAESVVYRPDSRFR